MLGHTNWSEMFPTKWSALIFVSYMGLFINQGILVTASQSSGGGEYNYNTVTVVLLTEVLKLAVSVVFYCKDNSLPSFFYDIKKYSRVMMLYFVPAFMYCLYNNLAFVNLATFDPTTYYLLLQFRVVITGVVFQVLFKKQLSCKQWMSLLLLTMGCVIKHLDLNSSPGSKEAVQGTDLPSATQASSFSREISTLFILVQTVCSCFAGVYNEFLLKGEGAQVNIFMQNVFMYVDSIICNTGVLLVQGNFTAAFQPDALLAVVRPTVLLIMINNGAIGIITSFFLKNLNSILKTFASAMELMFTAVFCWLLFGIPIHLSTLAAIAIVSYSVLLYSQNPVINQTPTSTSAQSKEPLLTPLTQKV